MLTIQSDTAKYHCLCTQGALAFKRWPFLTHQYYTDCVLVVIAIDRLMGDQFENKMKNVIVVVTYVVIIFATITETMS